MSNNLNHGSCLCGAVQYETNKPLRPVVACHCSQCRKQSGHFYAATTVADDGLKISGAEHLTWYEASSEAKRGFCKKCGSALFWKNHDQNTTAIMAGSLDGDAGIKLEQHIFVEDKGAYYNLNDGLPKHIAGRQSQLIKD